MEDLEEKLRASAVARDIQLVYTARVTGVNGKAVDGLFGLSETRLEAFAVKKKDFCVLCSHGVYDVGAVQLSELEDDVIKIKVGSKYMTLVSAERKRIAEEVTKVLARALTKEEFEKVKVPEFNGELPHSTAFNVLNRIKNHVDAKRFRIPESVMASIEHAVLCQAKSVSLNHFKGFDKAFPYLLACFGMKKEIEEIRFQDFQGVDLWELLGNYVEPMEQIVSVACETAELSIIGFLDRRTKPLALSFTKDVSPRVLKKILQSDKVNNLSLASPTHETWSKLVNCPGFKNLRFFSAVNVPKVDIAIATQRCRHIYALSLPNSGLLIGNVLELLSISEWDNLRGIDLSGNIGRGFIDSNLSLPKNVFKIHVNSVTWESKALIQFLNLIGKHKTSMKLSMAKTMGYSDDVFKNVNFTSSPALHLLIWDGNNFTKELASMLLKFPKLAHLSLNNCINDGNISHLRRLLRKNRNITALSLQNAYFHTPSDIIAHIRAMKHIKSMDISQWMIDDATLLDLGSLLARNHVLETLIVDETDVSSIDAWKGFVTQLSKRKQPLTVSFPVHDFARFEIGWESYEFVQFSRVLSRLARVEADVVVRLLSDPFPDFLNQFQVSRLKKESHRMRKTIEGSSNRESLDLTNSTRRDSLDLATFHKRESLDLACSQTLSSMRARTAPIVNEHNVWLSHTTVVHPRTAVEIAPRKWKVKVKRKPEMSAWEFVDFPHPEIDNSAVCATLRERFSFDSLLKELM